MHSRHPLSRALVRAFPTSTSLEFENIREVPGYGLEAELDGHRIRLGRRAWCGLAQECNSDANMEIHLSYGAVMYARFTFSDALRSDAIETITDLMHSGFKVELLSGDLSRVVEQTAKALNIESWQAECLPADKGSLKLSGR